MDDHTTISTFQLFKMFPDNESARVYLEGRLWPKGVRCPICGLGERIGNHSPGLYRCFQCKEAFSVRTGTIFERSHVPLQHIGRYVNEFTFRLNDGNVKRLTLDRLNSMIAATVGRRITYAELIA